ncbi:TfoX/Sxy family protein [Saccharospirillum salsuginis]|uniref:TfoX N-terminal domain-containing protein n=1 Tax=Saccharospirillum salsuginis TaxID=418750 RepID=A0A918NBY4_9GAMM|nr:TfoX/Sxy family protein [Saccharospirillum salsuginis]GGX59153.1 hypothetical protein GCM10007392_28640 [Saccharospirillum salsuginis]
MAYDEGLAQRIRDYFQGRTDVVEKKMFGGLCFMVHDHMCCGLLGNDLMARIGPDHYEEHLALPHAKPMEFTGRPMKGILTVEAEGLAEDADLFAWIDRCVAFVDTLPPKAPKKSRKSRTSARSDDAFAGLSAPARRALANAGINTLKDLSRYSQAEILKLHGMGPSSIPKLEKALRDGGFSFQ